MHDCCRYLLPCASRGAGLDPDVAKPTAMAAWMLHGLRFGGKPGHVLPGRRSTWSILRGRRSTWSTFIELSGSPATSDDFGRRVVLCGKRSTCSISGSFCVAGAALGASSGSFCVAGAALGALS